MTSLLENLITGFSVVTNPIVLLYAFGGVLCGVIIGALPGLGPSVGIAVLLPLTYGMDAATGIILLAGIYYGAMYGGSITAILINTPGDSAAVMTAMDGYPLSQKGQAGKALGMAAYASIIGGTIAVVAFMLLAPVISQYALMFGSSEYFALMVLGMTSIAGMTGKSPAKGFLSAFIGLFIACIGMDLVNGSQRYVFGNIHLFSGIDFIPVAMGLFGIAEIISEKSNTDIRVEKDMFRPRNLFPTKREWADCLPHIGRGTVLGFLVGMLPGAGATIASFLSYDMAKRTSKNREAFGSGVLEGVAAPESANNAASMGAMVPMLTLGVPGSGSTAIMMGALMMLGITPGPSFFTKAPDVAWGLVASMYIGNIFLLFLGICGLPLFVKVLQVKTPILNAVVLAFILVGAYALENSMFTVGLTIFFGMIGYFMKKFEIPAAPMVLAIVLGYLTESNLRQALIIGNGNFIHVITKPISATILVIALIMAFGKPLSAIFKKMLLRTTQSA